MSLGVSCPDCRHPLGSWWGLFLSVRCRRCGHRAGYDLQQGDQELRCRQRHPKSRNRCDALVARVKDGALEAKCRRCRRHYEVPVDRDEHSGLDSPQRGVPTCPPIERSPELVSSSPASEPHLSERSRGGAGISSRSQSRRRALPQGHPHAPPTLLQREPVNQAEEPSAQATSPKA